MFKMKLSYMAWVRKIDFFQLFCDEIKKTLEQQELQIIQNIKTADADIKKESFTGLTARRGR